MIKPKRHRVKLEYFEFTFDVYLYICFGLWEKCVVKCIADRGTGKLHRECGETRL